MIRGITDLHLGAWTKGKSFDFESDNLGSIPSASEGLIDALPLYRLYQYTDIDREASNFYGAE